MPIYEYRCSACGHRFEELQKMSDPLVEECPECGEKQVSKLVSATAFLLKGSGWYSDHYGLKPSADAGDSGASDSGGSGSGASDSGASDSGASDSGGSDSGASDSGASDSGASDSGASDSGASSTSDSGSSSSGTPPATAD